jgi:hypothetical protein
MGNSSAILIHKNKYNGGGSKAFSKDIIHSGKFHKSACERDA